MNSLRNLPRRLFTFARTHHPSAGFPWGFAAGMLVVIFAQGFWSRFGVSLVPFAAWSLAVAVGLLATFGERVPTSRGLRWGLAVAPFAWIGLLPVLYRWSESLLSAIPLHVLSVPLWGFLTVFVIALMSVGVGHGLLVLSASASVPESSRSSRWCGLGLGAVAQVTLLGPILGGAWSLLIAAVVIVSLLAIRSPRESAPTTQEQPAPPNETQFTPGWAAIGSLAVGSVLAGLAFVVTHRVLQQTVPTTMSFEVSLWASVAIGFAIGSLVRTSARTLPTVMCGILATPALAVLSVHFLLPIHLAVNVHVSSLVGLVLFRLALGTVCLPLGWAIGSLFFCFVDGSALKSVACRFGVVGLPLGLIAARSAFASGVEVTTVGAILWLIAAILAVIGLVPAWRSLPRLRARAALVAVTALVACLPLAGTVYEPEVPTRLLFSSNVFLNYRQGVGRDRLMVLDEGRLIERIEGDTGTLTLWKYRGVQVQMRNSGMPTAVASRDAELCPHFPGELLPTVVTLSLHPEPSRVLMLGLGSGTPLTTSLAFPVQQLDCCEPEPALADAVRRQVWGEAAERFENDPRVRTHQLPPQQAIHAGREEYDVIFSFPNSPILTSAAGCHDREFYRAALGRLAPGGIFCQRFSFLDLGREPFRDCLQTARSVFPELTVMEVSGSEVILLGSGTSGALRPEGFVDRLKLPQTRRLLAEIGWDYAEALNLSAISNRELSLMLAEERPTVGTGFNGRFAYRWPHDALRWSDKVNETRTEFLTHAGRYLEWSLNPENETELVRRIGEVQTQRNLMTRFPDQPWAYRKAVKEQLEKSPRTLLHQESGELARHEIHPEDRRRLNYFQALSDAFGKETLTQKDIDQIWDHVQPYDPLLTEFCHQELVRILPKCESRDVQRELRHHLHTVNFSRTGDRSVRDVVAAMELILDHPESLDDRNARTDHLAALLERLRFRWLQRGLHKPIGSVDILLNDVGKSIVMSGRAIEEIDATLSDTHFDPEQWSLRKDHLESQLMAPLRDYQTVLLQHHQKRRENLRKIKEDPKAFEHLNTPQQILDTLAN